LGQVLAREERDQIGRRVDRLAVDPVHLIGKAADPPAGT
jgi:hypothetical protein